MTHSLVRFLRLVLISALGLVVWVPPLAQAELINGSLVLVGTQNYCDATGSTGDAFVCNLDPAITTYVTGATYLFKASAANVGAATLNLNSVGAKTIVKVVGGITTALADNDIRSGQFVLVTYDGTNMQMQSTLANLPASLLANGANCTVAGTFPNGVDASGAAENCVALSGSLPKTATYQIVVGDFNAYKTIPVASGTFTLTLPAAANQPSDGKFIDVINYGSGVVTIARTDTTLNGGTASLVLAPGTALIPTSARIVSDGTNYVAHTAFGNPMTTAGDFLYGGTSGTPTRLAAGTGLVRGNGASAPTIAELSGDCVTAGSNACTIPAGTVTLAKMANIATATLIGRTTAGTGVPEALTVLPAALEPAHTGDVTNTAGSLAMTLATKLRTRTCMIVIGADNGPVLIDADLGPQLHQCRADVAMTVTEIAVYADAGTPNVIVHRRTGTTNTALLSSALATAASGAIACSKTTGVTGLDGATTCSATLQNTTVAAGHTLGLTSGTAGGVAKRMAVAITMTID